jgi:hypothetical protein
VALPVRFGAVAPGHDIDAGAASPLKHIDRRLVVASGSRDPLTPGVLKAEKATESILIAHGDVVLNNADHCLIVATGAVEVTQAISCTIFAGRVIDAVNDLEGVLISGSKLRIQLTNHMMRAWTRKGIYSAPDVLTINGHGVKNDTIFLNSAPAPRDGSQAVAPGDAECRSIDWPGLDFADASRSEGNQLEGRVFFLVTMYPFARLSLRGGGVFVEVPHAVLGLDDTLGKVTPEGWCVDPRGRPIPGLEGWRVYRHAVGYTMVSHGPQLLDVEHRRHQTAHGQPPVDR